MIRYAVALLAMLPVSACESISQDVRPRGMQMYADDPRLGEPAESMCITDEVDGFLLNERQTVVVREGLEHFVLEVNRSCFELENAGWLSVDTENGRRMRGYRQCVSPGGVLLVSKASSGTASWLGPQRCTVKELRRWHPEAKKRGHRTDDEQAAGKN